MSAPSPYATASTRAIGSNGRHAGAALARCFATGRCCGRESGAAVQAGLCAAARRLQTSLWRFQSLRWHSMLQSAQARARAHWCGVATEGPHARGAARTVYALALGAARHALALAASACVVGRLVARAHGPAGHVRDATERSPRPKFAHNEWTTVPRGWLGRPRLRSAPQRKKCLPGPRVRPLVGRAGAATHALARKLCPLGQASGLALR